MGTSVTVGMVYLRAFYSTEFYAMLHLLFTDDILRFYAVHS